MNWIIIYRQTRSSRIAEASGQMLASMDINLPGDASLQKACRAARTFKAALGCYMVGVQDGDRMDRLLEFVDADVGAERPGWEKGPKRDLLHISKKVLYRLQLEGSRRAIAREWEREKKAQSQE